MKFSNVILSSIALISMASTTPIDISKTISKCNWGNTKYGKVDKDSRVYAEQVWDFLVEKIGNENDDIGRKYEKSLALSDEQYVKIVNSGTYQNFATDKVDFGIGCWSTRYKKNKLLEYAKDNGKSIGDINMQLEFLWKEINEDYGKLANILKDKTVTIQEASDAVVLNYDVPLDRSQSMLSMRANYGKMFKDACGSQ
ncbi:hypothetical protein PIROE2DRAFT_17776 [Piromyces sp. E2]|nr:hypothetical protein PIROE2DRAFT_17776 [Piromyces sp. E2]|eukprot:OUM57290.1 hypothetical protein PIROE2DRAFT_17776 [Piromyces sp. E2]